METLRHWLQPVRKFLDTPIFALGESQLTLWTFLKLVILIFLLFYLTTKLKSWIVQRLLVRSRVDVNTRQAIGSVVQYLVIVIGLLIILQTAGIDLTTLNILAGAVGIGVGFGLQNIANNFIAGLIILFERPIKVGDRIEVGTIEGDVVEINARSTTVVTNDNIAIIVPNSKFVTENIVNWSHTDPKVRFHIPVSVAYGTDVRLVEKLLLDVARENPDVLDNPPPAVRLLQFGDNGLQLELRAWTAALLHRRGRFLSALNFAIYDKFRQHGIEIPFPQRDLHIRGGRLDVKTPSG